MEDKKINFIITLFLGGFGVHKFIKGDVKIGILYLFTGGLFGIGWFVDIIKSLLVLFNNNDKKINTNEDLLKDLSKDNYDKTDKGNIRKSTRTFAFFYDDNKYLRYEYYDVDVKGIEYRNFDISKIDINHQLYFENEPDNTKDPNAIKILYDDIFIGYIPNNNLQSMMLSYGFNDEKEVTGMTYFVDEENKKIQIALGFYDKIDIYIDTKLIKITEKDDVENRQENLYLCEKDEKVDLTYNYETETYVVTARGFEIGEINKKNSIKLQEYEDEGLEFKAGILDIEEDDNGYYECKIRIIIK